MENQKQEKEILNHLYKFYKGKLDEINCSNLNDKEYLKKLFKEYDNSLSDYEDEVILNINKCVNIPEIEKVALFLRFKKFDSYREKIKAIKKINISFENLVISEKRFEDIEKTIEKKIIDCENGKMDLTEEEVEFFNTQRKYLNVYLNTIVIMKCILHNYYKKDLSSFDNGKPKFKIIKNKAIKSINNKLKVSNISHLYNYESFLIFMNFMDRETNKIKNNNGMPILNNQMYVDEYIYLCLNETYITDEYNKLLLDKKYLTEIENKVELGDIDHYTIPNSLLTERKVLIPTSGVILLVKNNEYIESIYLKEKILQDKNHIIMITRYKDGQECVNSVMLDLDFETMQLINDKFANVINNTLIMYVLHFFGVLTDCEDLEYEVIAPTYWKYRKNGYIASGDKLSDKGLVVKREFQIDIAPFLRKVNSEASEDAKKLAISLGLELEEGYTVVRPHTRTYNKVK